MRGGTLISRLFAIDRLAAASPACIWNDAFRSGRRHSPEVLEPVVLW